MKLPWLLCKPFVRVSLKGSSPRTDQVIARQTLRSVKKPRNDEPGIFMLEFLIWSKFEHNTSLIHSDRLGNINNNNNNIYILLAGNVRAEHSLSSSLAWINIESEKFISEHIHTHTHTTRAQIIRIINMFPWTLWLFSSSWACFSLVNFDRCSRLNSSDKRAA